MGRAGSVGLEYSPLGGGVFGFDMIWKAISLKRFWARWVGLSACSLALLPLSGNAETYSEYFNRLRNLWSYRVEEGNAVWCWSQVPGPQAYWNSCYDCLVSYSTLQANNFETVPPVTYVGYNQNGNGFRGTIASNFPSYGHVWPFTEISIGQYSPSAEYVGIVNPCFPVGSCVPLGTYSLSGYVPPVEYDTGLVIPGYFSQTNIYSRTLLGGRAYILPQRVFVTNGWYSGTNSLLWDMYGDGRMFLPRLVAECGFLSMENVVPFDASLWEQLHFRGEYTRTKRFDSYPFIGLDWREVDWSSPCAFQDVIWYDGATRPARDFREMHISVTVTNQNLFGTNMLSPEQFPYMWQLLGLSNAPALDTPGSWRNMRYVPDSIQHGDFGVAYRTPTPTNYTPMQIAEIGKRGIRGLCFAPVNRQNGALLKFQRFVYQPLVRDAQGSWLGRMWFYVPSGLAWDSDGGCCFNWSQDGQPLSSLFKWPLTAAWDFSYVMDIATPGTMVGVNVAPTFTNLNSRIPDRAPVPPDNAPPIPAPPRGGTSSGGHGNTFTPLHPYGDDFTFTSGIILGNTSSTGGSGGRDTPISSTSLTYQNTENGLPVDDSGDLQGDYNITLPTYADFYTWDDFEDRNSLSFHISSELADNMSFADDEALFDFGLAGLPGGQFGQSLMDVGLGQADISSGSAPAQDGFYQLFDTSGQWFYERLGLEAMLPQLDTLVVPWPVHTPEGWDWSATHEFLIPERFSSVRPFLLWAVGLGLSLLFLACVMSLFSGGK